MVTAVIVDYIDKAVKADPILSKVLTSKDVVVSLGIPVTYPCITITGITDLNVRGQKTAVLNLWSKDFSAGGETFLVIATRLKDILNRSPMLSVQSMAHRPESDKSINCARYNISFW